MTIKLKPNESGATDAIGPLVLENAQEAATACGGSVVTDGVAFPHHGVRLVAPWGAYLITDGIGWGAAVQWWVDEYRA